MVEVLGREIRITPFNVGLVIGTVSFISIFYVESSLARNFIGFLIGSGFSPVFTSRTDHSSRYFALSFVLILFTFMVLAGFRYPMIFAFSVLALSALSEAEGRAALEVSKRQRNENKDEE
jgi:hypothetical protein